ncbi:MAG: AI-2E family transporter [Gammaproteobacteria bacterium]|nr:AI-2E family transporter [Gammaproteobacteria bacterium]MDH5803316.1 AI-2E family transporter [Gammaproteobacteria bacterium]
MITESKAWHWILIFSVLLALVYMLAPVLSPFLTGALLAYLGDPLVDRLEARKLPRTWAVVLVFLAIFVVLIAIPVIMLPLLEQQLSALIARLPQYMDWLQHKLVPVLSQTLNLDPQQKDMSAMKSAVLENWRQVGGVAKHLVQAVSHSGVTMLAWIANAILVPVVTFYLLRDWDNLVARVHALLPRQSEPVIVKLTRQSDEVLGAFLRGQLVVMLVLGLVYSLGLWLVGLDLAFLIGMTAGLVSFVPYLGFIVGIVLAGVAAFMQFHDVFSLLLVAGVFAVGQMLEGMVLTPMLVGDKIGLHPVAVIFAVMAGGQLFGFVGILLALPVAAVIMVVLRHLLEQYTQSGLYGAVGEATGPPGAAPPQPDVAVDQEESVVSQPLPPSPQVLSAEEVPVDATADPVDPVNKPDTDK